MTRKRIAGLAVAAGIATLAVSAPSVSADESVPRAKRQYPACAQEDGQNCVWQNTGPGFSFVSGPDTDPSGRESIARVRVSDRLAAKLVNRHGTWQRPEDWVGKTIDGVHHGSFTITPRTVVSEGGTFYAIKVSKDGHTVRIGTS